MDSNVSLADIAAVTDRNGYGCNGWGNNGMFGMEWIFALLILPMLWGGNGPFGNNGRGNPVTEADLCQSQSFAELKGSVGRGFDQQTQFAFQNQRDLCTSTATLSSQIANLGNQLAQCCCETQRAIDGVNYNAAINTAAINANTTAQIQSVKDMLCAQEAARKDARIWQLELNQAMYGIPRTTPYGYGIVPQFANYGCGSGWNNGCGCCNNNI